MKQLEQAILNAINSGGETEPVQKAYLQLFKSLLYLPVETDSDPEEPKVLFLTEDQQHYLPVFSEEAYLIDWAGDAISQIKIHQLSGFELLKGITENVTLVFNLNQASYKTFLPEEVQQLKLKIAKLESFTKN